MDPRVKYLKDRYGVSEERAYELLAELTDLTSLERLVTDAPACPRTPR